jgi:hypothetical protein
MKVRLELSQSEWLLFFMDLLNESEELSGSAVYLVVN